MGKASRDKGKRGEVELCQVLHRHGWNAKRTAMMQTADDQSFPDIMATRHGHTLAIESKNARSLPPKGVTNAIEQVDQALVGSPNVARAVFMRIEGQPGQYIVAMRSEELFRLLSLTESSKPQ
ncbi:MAG: hypothetical protein AAFP15_15775 [Bacteroidota bacterium]